MSLSVYKSMEQDNIHPRVPKGLADVVARPPSTIFEESWLSGKVPGDRKNGTIAAIFKEGKKEDPGNYRLVSLTSMPGKITEWLRLEGTLKVI